MSLRQIVVSPSSPRGRGCRLPSSPAGHRPFTDDADAADRPGPPAGAPATAGRCRSAGAGAAPRPSCFAANRSAS